MLKITTQKIKFSIKDFFSKCDQIQTLYFCAVRNNVLQAASELRENNKSNLIPFKRNDSSKKNVI